MGGKPRAPALRLRGDSFLREVSEREWIGEPLEPGEVRWIDFEPVPRK